MYIKDTKDMLKVMKEDFESVGADKLYESNINSLIKMGYFDAPASSKYHGTSFGDLFRHSMHVAKTLKQITDHMKLPWQDPRSPILIGYFHDLCKCDNYLWSGDIDNWDYRKDKLLEGHGDKSVMIASTLCQLTEEEMLCIRYHMGAYETKDWEGYDRAIKKYPNVLWTHTADMLASKVIGI